MPTLLAMEQATRLAFVVAGSRLPTTTDVHDSEARVEEAKRARKPFQESQQEQVAGGHELMWQPGVPFAGRPQTVNTGRLDAAGSAASSSFVGTAGPHAADANLAARMARVEALKRKALDAEKEARKEKFTQTPTQELAFGCRECIEEPSVLVDSRRR